MIIKHISDDQKYDQNHADFFVKWGPNHLWTTLCSRPLPPFSHLHFYHFHDEHDDDFGDVGKDNDDDDGDTVP